MLGAVRSGVHLNRGLMAPASNHHDKGQTDQANDDRRQPHKTDEGYEISYARPQSRECLMKHMTREEALHRRVLQRWASPARSTSPPGLVVAVVWASTRCSSPEPVCPRQQSPLCDAGACRPRIPAVGPAVRHTSRWHRPTPRRPAPSSRLASSRWRCAARYRDSIGR